MAIYFPNQVPSTGQKAGESFASGIGNVLNMLAQQKLSHVQQRQQQGRTGKALESLGIPSQVGMLPENIQQAFIKQHLAQPQQQAFAEALSGLLGNEQQQTAPVAQDQTSPTALTSEGQPQQKSNTTIPKGLNQQQATQLAQIGLKKQAAEQKIKAEQTKEARIEQHAADKETKTVYDEIQREAKSAKNNDKRLDKMENLIQNGNLSHPLFASAIKTIGKGIFGFGIDLSSLLNPESQQFEKLSNDFIREAKSIFGNRLTDADLNAFLKTVPTLSQSNEGKMLIIQNMRQFNEASKIKEIAMNEIIKDNGGRRPRNLVELIDERTAPQLDALAEKFKSAEPLAVPSTQSFPESIYRSIF